MARTGAGETRHWLFAFIHKDHRGFGHSPKPMTLLEQQCKHAELAYLHGLLDIETKSHTMSSLKAVWEHFHDAVVQERHENDEILAAMLIGCMISGTVPETR